MRFTAHVLSGDSRYKINDQRRILIYLHHFEGRPVQVRIDGDIAQFSPTPITPSHLNAEKAPLSWGIDDNTGDAWIFVPGGRKHDREVEVVVKRFP